jgi:hypothetical protein
VRSQKIEEIEKEKREAERWNALNAQRAIGKDRRKISDWTGSTQLYSCSWTQGRWTLNQTAYKYILEVRFIEM